MVQKRHLKCLSVTNCLRVSYCNTRWVTLYRWATVYILRLLKNGCCNYSPQYLLQLSTRLTLVSLNSYPQITEAVSTFFFILFVISVQLSYSTKVAQVNRIDIGKRDVVVVYTKGNWHFDSTLATYHIDSYKAWGKFPFICIW